MRQTLARSLLDSVASAVKTLAVPLSSVSGATCAEDENGGVKKVDITAYTLARQYVLLLCRLDLLEVRLFGVIVCDVSVAGTNANIQLPRCVSNSCASFFFT